MFDFFGELVVSIIHGVGLSVMDSKEREPRAKRHAELPSEPSLKEIGEEIHRPEERGKL